jgi:glyoxylase-like metal-dependent hydrolase (beta-lactamase superfamily II)
VHIIMTKIRRVAGSVMAVNSYVIEGPSGVVVVDAQLTNSDARTVARAVRSTGKPLAAVVLTHGHPDHYAGLSIVTENAEIPIYASAEVDRVIRRDDELKNSIVGPMMGDEWPTSRRFPSVVVRDGDRVNAGGVTLRLQDVGAGESHADSLWFIDDRTVFCGDLASNNMHAYLSDGHYEAWLALLRRLEGDLAPDVDLHVGHGEPGGISLLRSQSRYIEAFLETVHDSLELDAIARSEVVTERMLRMVPATDLLFLMQLSIEPVAALLSSGGS